MLHLHQPELLCFTHITDPSRSCDVLSITVVASSCLTLYGRGRHPSILACLFLHITDLRRYSLDAMDKREITLGHSPDPDDAFMFYALATDQLDTEGLAFRHIIQDIETLNRRAMNAELDVTAISIHAYAYVLAQHALLTRAASTADN